MSVYSKHIFFCTNQKEHGKKCCNEVGAVDLCAYAKQKLIDLGLHGLGKIRVSQSGCLGRCSLGPNLVIYPEGVWYNYQTKEDIDQIIDKLTQ